MATSPPVLYNYSLAVLPLQNQHQNHTRRTTLHSTTPIDIEAQSIQSSLKHSLNPFLLDNQSKSETKTLHIQSVENSQSTQDFQKQAYKNKLVLPQLW